MRRRAKKSRPGSAAPSAIHRGKDEAMKTTILLSALAAALAGCATHESANVYDKHEAGREQVVRFATVESVRKVTIQGGQSGIGGAAGGVLGGVAGGVAGNAIEEKMTSKDALEITVRLDSGELRAIVQEADVAFTPGQRVRLLTSGGVTRVTP